MEYLGTNKPVNKIQPTVSVCVPTYNHESYIGKCLDGILMQQTSFAFEIIVGEDESSDKTRVICIEYANKYPDKIRLFLRSRKDVIYIDGRPTGKFNSIENRKAIRGKYIAHCDGDDHWNDKYKLQKQFDFLEKNPIYVLAFHDTMSIDDHDNLVEESMLPDKQKRDKTSIDIIAGKFIPTSTIMYRNKLGPELPEAYKTVINGDAFLFTLLAHHGWAKYLADIKPNSYRIHPGGIWSTLKRRERFKQNIHTREQLLPIVDEKYKWVIRRYLLVNNISLSLFCKGVSPRLKQYILAYRYFSFDRKFLREYVQAHQLLFGEVIKKVNSTVVEGFKKFNPKKERLNQLSINIKSERI